MTLFRARPAGHIDPIFSGLRAVLDHVRERPTLVLSDGDRLDGVTALVTGPSAGLGRAIAPELARRGARLILAARAGHQGLAEAVQRESGSPHVTQRPLDLADLPSVAALCDGLVRDGVKLDLVVSNAGIAPLGNRLTRDGFPELFQVNFLGAFLLVNRLWADGTLATQGPRLPRLVITSSEAHRLCPPIDFARFGQFPDFGMMDGTTWYGQSKLYVQTFACELGRRLRGSDGKPRASVFSFCPGAVKSSISREAGLAGRLMTAYFVDPAVARFPAIYCAASPALEGTSERYFYLRHEAQPAPRAADPANGAALWDLSVQALREKGYPLPPLPPGG